MWKSCNDFRFKCADFNACLDDPCNSTTDAVNGTCVDVAAPNTGYTCNCTQGYVWDLPSLSCVSKFLPCICCNGYSTTQLSRQKEQGCRLDSCAALWICAVQLLLCNTVAHCADNCQRDSSAACAGGDTAICSLQSIIIL